MKKLIGVFIVIGLVVAGIDTGKGLIADAEKRVAQRKENEASQQQNALAGTQTAPAMQQTAAASGKRTFVENEFYWDKDNSPYKDVIVKGTNKVFRENTRCHSLDPQSATTSTNKGTKKDPVFYVTCQTEDGQPFNVFFSKSDVEGGASLAAAAHINRGDALLACRDYAKAHATHPSSVDFSTFLDLGTTEFPNGRTRLDSSFTAKNAFNMEAKFNISCIFEGGKLIEGTIAEAQ